MTCKRSYVLVVQVHTNTPKLRKPVRSATAPIPMPINLRYANQMSCRKHCTRHQQFRQRKRNTIPALSPRGGGGGGGAQRPVYEYEQARHDKHRRARVATHGGDSPCACHGKHAHQTTELIVKTTACECMCCTMLYYNIYTRYVWKTINCIASTCVLVHLCRLGRGRGGDQQSRMFIKVETSI